MRKLSELLIAEGLLNRAQVDEALEAQALYGGGLDTCILELGLLDELTVEQAIVRSAGNTNQLDARADHPTPEALALLAPSDAARWRIVPFRIDGRFLDVISTQPPDLRMLDEVAFKTGLRVRPSVTSELRVAVLLEQYYRVPRSARLIDVMRGAVLRPKASGDDAYHAVRKEMAANDGPGMPSIDLFAMGGIDAYDPALAGFGQGPEPEITIDVETEPVKDDEPPAQVPEYKPVAYTPERFDASLAEFTEDRGEPTGVRRLNDRLRQVENRDDLPPLVFLFLAPHVQRAALFSVARGLCTGWDAAGGGIDPQRVRTMAFPLAHPSIFKEASEGDVFVGRMPLTKVNEEFARRMGSPRVQHVIVAPIKIRDKVVMMLVADCESERALERAFTHVVDTADKLARTLVRMILEKKRAAVSS